ncbi:DUF6542 domain-containing protein [Streptomyces sp. ZYX-F-203]
MEQHRTRPPGHGTRRDGSPLPPQAARRPGVGPEERPRPARVGRPGRSAPRGSARPASPRAGRGGGLRSPARAGLPTRLPGPRLTGLGCGLLGAVLMPTLGFLDGLLPGSPPTVYGVLFLPVCVLAALWVRRGDLAAVPVLMPIAFALGLLPLGEGDGPGDRAMGLVTALATEAPWLYGGTLAAGVIVLARRVRMVRAARRRTAAGRDRRPG